MGRPAHLGALLAIAAGRSPAAVALVEPRWTYEELARRVAAARQALAIAPGDRVVLALPKSSEALVLLLATLESGGVAVPLAHAQPDRRLAAQIAAAAPVVAVLDRPLPLPDGCRAAAIPDAQRSPIPPVPRDDDDLALILFTSGSTGAPKGVMLTHRNVRTFVDWAVEEFPIGPDDVVCAHAGLHFDLSTLDVFGALHAGAAIWIARPPLARGMAEAGVTVAYMVPSAWQLLLARSDDADLRRLRVAAFAGEVFPIDGLRRLRARLPDADLLNLYGPTETNVCTFHRLTDADLTADRPPPIGRPLPGVSVRAEAGELIVGGPGVSPGYWGDDDAQPRPEHRTGDAVERDDQGRWRFRGRLDRMVKLDGHRVEPAEVEAALTDGFAPEAAVLVVELDGRTRLVACCAGPAPRDALAMRAHVAERLPTWMIPHALLWLDALPRTLNGKVDRVALTHAYKGEAQ